MMIAEEMIAHLQKLPRDFEVYVSTYQDFGKPSKSKETIDIIAEMESATATIISK